LTVERDSRGKAQRDRDQCRVSRLAIRIKSWELEAGSWELGAGSWKLEADYSYRSASIGSSRDALIAGNRPKKMPTLAENPIPIANDHHGNETGNPEAQ
jgi:hypothetical protein